MVTGGSEAAFTGVYKLTAREGPAGHLIPVMKFSDNPEKNTTPGLKQLWRIKDTQGMTVADILSLEDAPSGSDALQMGKRYAFWHPSADYRHFYHTIEGSVEPLLKVRIDKGRITAAPVSLEDIRRHAQADLASFDTSYKRLLNPHVYKVSVTERLRGLKLDLIKNYLGEL
jgi:nicotinate phosphoribosyltransferase